MVEVAKAQATMVEAARAAVVVASRAAGEVARAAVAAAATEEAAMATVATRGRVEVVRMCTREVQKSRPQKESCARRHSQLTP